MTDRKAQSREADLRIFADEYGRYEEQLDLFKLIGVLWFGKWVVVICVLVSIALAGMTAYSLPSMYRSEALLAPTAGKNENSLAAVSGQFGGLANLAGLDFGLGRAGVDKTDLTLAVLQSRAFIVDFVRRHQLSVPLMAAESWDSQSGEWIIDPSLYDEARHKWIREPRPPYGSVPSEGEIHRKFIEQVLSVSKDSNSGLVRIGVTLLSPRAASQWAAWLVEDVNQHMRQRDIREAEININYLVKELESINIAEMKQVFYELVEEQTKSMMLAQVQPEYVLKMVDPPAIPEEKSSPRRGLILIAGAGIGCLLGVLFLLITHYVRINKKSFSPPK